eukprot:m.45873 g.45873  ORF g.45873 m.45873 type:complete len:433 (+) comp10699_c0_seq4:506-1804(+)
MNESPRSNTSSSSSSTETKKSSSTLSKVVRGVKRITGRHSKSDVERNYKLGHQLGTGNFAVVRYAEHRQTKKKYAIKIINKALCSGKEDMIETEINVLKKVDHKYVVGMKECFDTQDKLYLVLDYVSGGELFDRIVDEGHFTEADASRITKQMTMAIQYLHEHDIVHRDLKPENLLFRDKSPSSDILVTDFGLAKLLNDNVALKTACGTPNYVAPEILMQRGYGKQVDVWSLGVILFILLCGYPPFYDESDAVLFELIMKGKFSFDDRYWKHVSKEAKHLISMMLTVDPVKRYDTYQVLSHPWITGEANIPNVNLSKSISMNLKKTGLGQVKEDEDDGEDEEVKATTRTATSSSPPKSTTSHSHSHAHSQSHPHPRHPHHSHSHNTHSPRSSSPTHTSSSRSSTPSNAGGRRTPRANKTNLAKVPAARKTVV